MPTTYPNTSHGEAASRPHVFTGRILHATEGATLGLVTRLADDPVEVALHMAREIAGRSPHAVRGAKKLINHLSNDRAKEHFALEREIIFKLIGSASFLSRACSPYAWKA